MKIETLRTLRTRLAVALYAVEEALVALNEPSTDTLKPDDLQRVWNAKKSAKQPECKSLSPVRREAARARLRELPDLEQWAVIVERIAATEFCNGVNDRGWIADFDYLTRRKTWAHILDKIGSAPERAPKTASRAGAATRNANVDHVAKGAVYRPDA